MRPLILLLLSCFSLFSVQAQEEQTSLSELVEFLKSNSFQTPIEYLASSFDKKDIIIFSERYHPEFTQYEFLVDFLKKGEFKGDIYTEVGVFNQGPAIHDFLQHEGLTKEQKEERLLQLVRELDYEPLWPFTNYYFLLSSVYDINQGRKAGEKIMIHPLDIVFHWDSIKNHDQHKMLMDMMEPQNGLPPVIHRNAIMGKHFVRSYGEAKYKNPNKKKALVIMNTYHAYPHIPTYRTNPNEPRIYSTGQYIYKCFPEQTTSILINGLGNAGNLTTEGKWDAAFELNGNKAIGFDLKGTPFGHSKFDMYNFGGAYESAAFEDILQGFIFYKPLSELKFVYGIEGIFEDEDFKELYIKRTSISYGMSIEDAGSSRGVQKEIKEWNEVKEEKLGGLDEYQKTINALVEQHK